MHVACFVCWAPAALCSAGARFPLAVSAQCLFAAPFRSFAASLTMLKVPCHGPAVLHGQPVCCTPCLAVLGENLSHNGGSPVPAEMVGVLPADDI